MKSFLVISDTHGHASYEISRLVPIMNTCDFVVHLGDGANDLTPFKDDISCEVYAVKGNCDFSRKDKELIIPTDAGKVLFTHGDSYGVKSGDYLSLSYRAKELDCNYVFFGHTHVPEETEYAGVTLVNPGSLGKPRFGAPSYCICYIVKNKIITKIVSF